MTINNNRKYDGALGLLNADLDDIHCYINYVANEGMDSNKIFELKTKQGYKFDNDIEVRWSHYISQWSNTNNLAYSELMVRIDDYTFRANSDLWTTLMGSSNVRTWGLILKENIITIIDDVENFNIKFGGTNGITLSNCSVNYGENDIMTVDKPLRISANSGYVMVDDNYEYMVSSYGFQPFNFINYGGYLEVKISDWEGFFSDELLEDITIVLSNEEYNAIEGEVKFDFKFYGVEGILLSNCSVNYNKDDVMSLNKPLRINANVGYTMVDDNYEYLVSSYGLTPFNFINHGNYLEVSVSDWEMFFIEELTEDVYLHLGNEEYNAIEGEGVEYNSNIYKIDRNNLKVLSSDRFKVEQGLLADDVPMYYDYGKYILSLYELPFIISDDDYYGDLSNVYLSKIKTSAKGNKLKNDVIKIFETNINIPSIHNNLYDYINTMCLLHLPFGDSIPIDVDYVINNDINIVCYLNLYNGNVDYMVKSSFNNLIVNQGSLIIAKDIPFIQNDNIIKNISSSHIIKYDKCVLELIRNIPYYDDSIFGSEVIENDLIGSFDGYVRCRNVKIETVASKQEQEEIKSLLKSGVFI